MAKEPVKGNKLVYLFRVHEEMPTADGTILALTTENGITYNKDADSTATKDGNVRTPGEAEIEITATTMLPVGDTMLKKLKDAMLSDKLLDIWEANLSEPVEGQENKFKGTYFQGYMTNFEKSSPADGFVECTMTWGINGKGADGDVTVSVEDQEAAMYVFHDTPAETGTEGGSTTGGGTEGGGAQG